MNHFVDLLLNPLGSIESIIWLNLMWHSTLCRWMGVVIYFGTLIWMCRLNLPLLVTALVLFLIYAFRFANKLGANSFLIGVVLVLIPVTTIFLVFLVIRFLFSLISHRFESQEYWKIMNIWLPLGSLILFAFYFFNLTTVPDGFNKSAEVNIVFPTSDTLDLSFGDNDGVLVGSGEQFQSQMVCKGIVGAKSQTPKDQDIFYETDDMAKIVVFASKPNQRLSIETWKGNPNKTITGTISLGVERTLDIALLPGDFIHLRSDNPFKTGFVGKSGYAHQRNRGYKSGERYKVFLRAEYSSKILLIASQPNQWIDYTVWQGAYFRASKHSMQICESKKLEPLYEGEELHIKSSDDFIYGFGWRPEKAKGGKEFVVQVTNTIATRGKGLILTPIEVGNQSVTIRRRRVQPINRAFGFFSELFMLLLIGGYYFTDKLTVYSAMKSKVFPKSTTGKTEVSSDGRPLVSEAFTAEKEAPNIGLHMSQEPLADSLQDLEERSARLMGQLESAIQPKGIWDHYWSVRQSRRSKENLDEMSKLFSAMSTAINSASSVITAQNTFETEQIKRTNLKEITLLQAEVDRLKLRADIGDQKARIKRQEEETSKDASPPPVPSAEPPKNADEVRRQRIIEKYDVRDLIQDREVQSVAKAMQSLSDLKKKLLANGEDEEDVKAIIDSLKNRLLDEDA